MNRHTNTLPQWVWHNKFECVVEVLRTGCYPDTVKVKLPDDKVVETEIRELRLQEVK